LGGSGSGAGKFLAPSGVAVDSAGDIYVSDTNNHRIQKFDSGGVHIVSWGSNGSGDGELNTPAGLAIDSADNVYVADTGNNRIQKFNSSGSFITNGEPRAAATESSLVHQASALTPPEPSLLLTTGTVAFRLSQHRHILESFGSNGSDDGQFSSPQDVAIDAFGNRVDGMRVQSSGMPAFTHIFRKHLSPHPADC